jgi:hypothetical protein
VATALVPAICVLHLAETWAPVGRPSLRYFPPPDVYEWLAAQPGEFGIVELPSDPEQGTTAMVYSTFHWKSLVNGYYGSYISSFHDGLLFDVLPRFPRPEAVQSLSEIVGLRYIVVHDRPDPTHFPLKGRYQRRQRLSEALEALPPTLRLVRRSAEDAVLQLVEPADGWTGISVRRVAAASALRAQRVSLEARAVESAVSLPDAAELIVAVGRREMTRAPVSDRFSRFTFDLPADLPGGMQTLRFSVRGSAARARLAQHPDLIIGRTGVPTAAWIVAASERPGGASRAAIRVNGEVEVTESPGYVLAVVDPASGEVRQRAAFQVAQGRGEADRMAAYLEALPPGTVVAGATAGPIDMHCTSRMARALAGAGVALDPCSGRYRTHAFVGVMGAPPGTAAEATSATDRSVIEVGSNAAPPRVAIRNLTIGEAGRESRAREGRP